MGEPAAEHISFFGTLWEGLITGLFEGVALTVLGSFVVPRLIVHVEDMNACLKLVDECGRAGRRAVRERMVDPNFNDDEVGDKRTELGKLIQETFGSDTQYEAIKTAMAVFADALGAAEPGNPQPTGEAGLKIRGCQYALKSVLRAKARRHWLWKITRGKGLRVE